MSMCISHSNLMSHLLSLSLSLSALAHPLSLSVALPHTGSTGYSIQIQYIQSALYEAGVRTADGGGGWWWPMESLGDGDLARGNRFFLVLGLS